MGHEVLLHGMICGATYRSGDDFRKFQLLNEKAFASLPVDQDYPWVDRSIFSLPGPYPVGTYRAQLIHFALSMKDDPSDKTLLDSWLAKFEQVLCRFYWESVVLTLETDFTEGVGQIVWKPTELALAAMYERTEPIKEWKKSRYKLNREKLVCH